MDRGSATNERSWEALPNRRNIDSVSDHSSVASVGNEVGVNTGEHIEWAMVDLHDMYLDVKERHGNNRLLLYTTFLNELEPFTVRWEDRLGVRVPEHIWVFAAICDFPFDRISSVKVSSIIQEGPFAIRPFVDHMLE